MPTPASEPCGPGPRNPEHSADSDILCMCLNLTRDDIRKHINAGADFPTVMAATGAGSKCTACLLDLEYFCEAVPTENPGSNTTNLNQEQRPPLRRRIYAFIDRILPLKPITLSDISPVLYGPGIRQEFCVSNMPAQAISHMKMDPLNVDLTLRDAEGRVVMKRNHRLESGDVLWEPCEAIEHLSTTVPQGSFAVGSLLIQRRWAKPSIRGASRPHFLIYTSAGVGNLHTQDSGGRVEEFFRFPNRSGDHRSFLTIVNDSDHPERLTVDYPITQSPETAPYSSVVSIPPRGARVVEVDASLARAHGASGPLFLIRIRGQGRRKTHIVYASDDLSVMSIDHLAS